MTDTVRETRRADELKPGDWLAQDENGALKPNEVMAVFQYPTAGGPRVHLTTQVPGRDPFSATGLAPDLKFELATESELNAARERAERAQKIADMRALLTWLEANPFVPMPYSLDAHEHWSNGIGDPDTETAMATARDVAARLGVELDMRLDDRTRLKVPFGRSSYELCVWHRDGRPAEPAPEPCDASRHVPAQTEDARCFRCGAPGVVAAYEPDTGAVTDEGLVDESEAIARHYDASDTGGTDCACGRNFDGPNAVDRLKSHIARANAEASR